MRRTTVFAADDDLATLRAAAARRGVPEAQLIREAIHRAALAARQWDEPFFSRSFVPGQDAPILEEAEDETRQAATEAYAATRDRSA